MTRGVQTEVQTAALPSSAVEPSPYDLLEITGGERGIRTLGTLARTHDFQSCTFGHSVISPLAPVPLPRLAEPVRARESASRGALVGVPIGPVGRCTALERRCGPPCNPCPWSNPPQALCSPAPGRLSSSARERRSWRARGAGPLRMRGLCPSHTPCAPLRSRSRSDSTASSDRAPSGRIPSLRRQGGCPCVSARRFARARADRDRLPHRVAARLSKVRYPCAHAPKRVRAGTNTGARTPPERRSRTASNPKVRPTPPPSKANAAFSP
jgi:hypothetical protein